MAQELTISEANKDDEIEIRLSAKRLRQILEAGLSEVLSLDGTVIDFRLLEDRAVVTIKVT